jgi:cell division protein ZapB
MNTQDNQKTDYQEQGPKKGIVIIVITILLGTNGLLLWQFFEKKNRLDDANKTIYSTTAERDALQVQLQQVKADFEKAKSENSSLQTQLSEREQQINEKSAEIQRLIALGGPAQIARAKAELAKLKEMNQLYVAQLDSLNQVASRLQAENTDLSSNLSQARNTNDKLSAQNTMLSSKVAAGSVLKAMSPVTEGVRYRSNGKESLTDRAKQVQKIRTRFTLAENKVIDRGSVDLYIRVVGPDGAVMSSMQDAFNSNGQSLNYTLKETVDYANADTPVEVSWAKGTQFAIGTYNVEIYHSGTMIGKSSIQLK